MTRAITRTADTIQDARVAVTTSTDPAVLAAGWAHLKQPIELAAAGGDGEALWQELRPEFVARYEANHRAYCASDHCSSSGGAAAHCPPPGDLRQLAQMLRDLRWIDTGSGLEIWRQIDSGWKTQWLGEFPQDLVRASASGEALLLAGVSDPQWLRTLLRHRPNLFLTMKSATYCVLADRELWRALLWSQDLVDLLEREELHWVVGEEELRALFDVSPMLPFPVRTAVIQDPRFGTAWPVDETIAAASLHRAEQAHKDLERTRAYHDRLDLSTRFAGGSLRVLFLTSRFTTVLQYVIRDLEQGFQALGHDTRVAIEQRDDERLNSAEVARTLAEFEPDLIVQVDGFRPIFEWLDPRVPFVGWVQDRLPRMFDPTSVKQLGERDFLYGMWPEVVAECIDAGYPKIDLLPSAVDGELYGSPPRYRQEYASDVAFVSNVSKPEPDALLAGVRRYVRREGFGLGDRDHYRRLREHLERELDLKLEAGSETAFEHRLYVEFERYLHRTQIVRWAIDAGMDIALYGRGWEQDPEFAPYSRGPVAPGEDLRDLYFSARCHLQINLDTNVHSRVFECLAAGGCILAAALPADREPGGLGDALALDTEVRVFDDRQDLERQVSELLSDSIARQQLIDAGRTRVLRDHTYVRRASRIVADLRRALGPDRPDELGSGLIGGKSAPTHNTPGNADDADDDSCAREGTTLCAK